MLSKKVNAALNAQLAAETYSAYFYSSMAAWLQSEGFQGSAHWMSIQVREELFHSIRFFNYIQERGGAVKLAPIEAPPAKWASAQAVFEAAHAHEQKVTALLNNLMSLAKAEGDHATEIFMQWFITEQVEEEATVLEIARKYKLAENHGASLFMIDKDLAARVMTPLVQAGITGAPLPVV